MTLLAPLHAPTVPIWNKCTFSINCLYFSFKERRGREGERMKRTGSRQAGLTIHAERR